MTKEKETQTQTAVARELATSKHLLDSLNHLDFKTHNIIANYIEKEANVTGAIALEATYLLFGIIIMYTSAVEKYLEGKTSALTADLMIIKTRSDFDLSIGKDAFRKCLDSLQNLGFIEKKVFRGITHLRPVANKIVEARKSFEEVVEQRRAERVEKKTEAKKSLKRKNEDFTELQKDIISIDTSKLGCDSEINGLIGRSGLTFDDITLIKYLNETYGTISRIEFYTVRKYLGGKGFTLKNDIVDVIKRSKEEFDRLGWSKAKKGTKMVMAIKNTRCPGTYKDFRNTPEKKEVENTTSNPSYGSRDPYLRRLANMGR